MSLSFYFFLFIFSTFSFSPFFFIFFFFSFNIYPYILIITLFFVLFFSHQKTIKKEIETKHIEDEHKHHQRAFISFFLDAALAGERTAGMKVAALQHCSGVTEEGMPEMKWSYLNPITGTIFGFLHIAVTAFDFLLLLSCVFVVVEESFTLKLMAYNSDLWLCTENR